ncbi:hypothetical protein HNQ51_001750 [Inhella inkyongensis]|uniref:Uncharacterized protein n=1 Tax=Inhella inkyongensis TaxID=392593 RepID=A0A840S601_9BURK|nr:hypothetical protein [Inhella inkyongensis]MBB5204436.1 hypothetical protein [Inhella inkyongensis]
MRALLIAVAVALLGGLLMGGSCGRGQGYRAGLAEQAPRIEALQRELSQTRAEHAEAARLAAVEQARRLAAAHAHGERLSAELRHLEHQQRQQAKERSDAMVHFTRGSPCLGDDALRLLDGAPGLRVARVPAPAQAAAGADAPTATAASDRDLAGWALDVGQQYEACRQRIDALRAWHDNTRADVKGPLQ